MIRLAEAKDVPALAAFLEARIETSMFLLSNLERLGIDDTTHPHGTRFFLRETGDGITGVFGATNAGFLMCQLPGLTVTEAQTYAHLLKGYTLQGMTGVADQAGLILSALQVPQSAWLINHDEPLYRLSLHGFDAPGVVTRIAEDGDVPLLARWFTDYMVATGTRSAEDAPAEAMLRAEQAVGSERVRLLVEGGTPVAMAGINAQAGDAVQVGGVFVPPELRGQGLGGRVVAGLLADKAAKSAMTAILFANSPAAARTYERIGFERIGDYRVAVLAKALTLGEAA